MVFGVRLDSIQVMTDLRCARGIESCQKRRVFSNIRAAKRKTIILELRNGPVVLKVRGNIRITVHEAGHGIGRTFHVHAVGADFQRIILVGGRPGCAPVGCDTSDIDAETYAIIGLRAPDML